VGVKGTKWGERQDRELRDMVRIFNGKEPRTQAQRNWKASFERDPAAFESRMLALKRAHRGRAARGMQGGSGVSAPAPEEKVEAVDEWVEKMKGLIRLMRGQ
jgi:hypothetical protein